MKYIFTLLTFSSLFALASHGQIPQGISYQAIAFNSGGNPIMNGNVGVRISILDNSAEGTVVYSERHTKTTNAQGLFNLNIGQGSPITGLFSAINWGANSKFLKVEIDPNGGTNYTNIGTNQLMSVPYAMFSEKSSSIANNGSINDDLVEYKYANFAYYDNNSDMVYAFNQKTGTWVGQSDGSSNIVASNGSFAFYGNTTDKVYVFNQKTGTWIGQSDGSSSIVASNGSFAFYGNTTDKVYVFNQKTGAWVGQSDGSSDIIASNGSFAFYGNTTNKVYVFNKDTGAWVSQNGGGSGIIASPSN